jgi:hypothetical protein
MTGTAPSPSAVRIAALAVHPIKSCGAVPVDEAALIETGLEWDREWMLVDRHGEMLTQRELPRLALVQPDWRGGQWRLRAPGMLALHLSPDNVGDATQVQVWDDRVRAYDMGDLAAQWFADFLGPPHGSGVRLVRFDPEQRRLSSAKWTGEVEAENAFSDGYPILVANAASLADLNQRLAARGQAAVTMTRFRPNVVLAGLEPWDEDHLKDITIHSDDGPVRLRLVKPCSRCSIPNVDPASAASGHEPGDTLAGFRADARVGGAVTFGINAVVVEGFGHTLRLGQAVDAPIAFE